MTLIGALKARGLKRGVASLCIGGGDATAMGGGGLSFGVARTGRTLLLEGIEYFDAESCEVLDVACHDGQIASYGRGRDKLVQRIF